MLNNALIPAAIDWNTRLLTSPTFELTIMPSNLNLKQPTLGWNPKKHIPFQDLILKCQDLILIYFNGDSTNIYHTKT
jgi:hypothetical protein